MPLHQRQTKDHDLLAMQEMRVDDVHAFVNIRQVFKMGQTDNLIEPVDLFIRRPKLHVPGGDDQTDREDKREKKNDEEITVITRNQRWGIKFQRETPPAETTSDGYLLDFAYTSSLPPLT